MNNIFELIKTQSFLIYLIPLLIIWLVYSINQQLRHKKSLKKQTTALKMGLGEPASLHPIIDPNLCLGCGACTKACPEGDILGLIHGKAQLIAPANCIGHGACKAACPFDAITLVFGTEKRGIDIPALKPNFETNVDGLFIAGELGGMGLIRNAIEQGKQAIDAVQKKLTQKQSSNGDGNTTSRNDSKKFDLIIVGAGPAGIAASLAAKEKQLNYLTIDQDSLGGTVSHFPRNKIVMTAPVELPLIGKTRFKETTKEALLEFWQEILNNTKLQINFDERLLDINATPSGFQLTSSQGEYTAKTILLCLGRRGTPRTLDVPGEELSKVVYRLIDPAQYQDQHVLVVGGGDSALEAALSIAEEANTTVTLSYRSDSFARAKAKNRDRIDQAIKDGAVTVMLQSQVKKIHPASVELEYDRKTLDLKNDGVIICAGGILPTPFLEKIGITIETKYGTA